MTAYKFQPNRLFVNNQIHLEIAYELSTLQCNLDDDRGVWLDRGELDKIIERAGALSPVAVPQPVTQHGYASQPQQPAYTQSAVHSQFGGHSSHHDSHNKDNHGYGHNKKKSMLSDLFDF